MMGYEVLEDYQYAIWLKKLGLYETLHIRFKNFKYDPEAVDEYFEGWLKE